MVRLACETCGAKVEVVHFSSSRGWVKADLLLRSVENHIQAMKEMVEIEVLPRYSIRELTNLVKELKETLAKVKEGKDD